MLLIHGAGLDGRFWEPVVERIQGTAVHLPGRGRGLALRTVQEMAETVLETLRSRTEPTLLVGHSLGGAVALEVALTDPRPLSGLVLISTGGRLRVRPEILSLASESVQQGIPMEINHLVLPDDVPARYRELILRIERSIPPETAYADWQAAHTFDRLGDLGRIRLPTRILVGEDDRMTPPKYASFLAEKIPNASLRIMEERGHMLPIEVPEAIAAELRAFAALTSGSARPR